jgi:poly-gamma-glutamate capsule biosynthesis protein CapA/YwtB (metallophosphatase superfamily)
MTDDMSAVPRRCARAGWVRCPGTGVRGSWHSHGGKPMTPAVRAARRRGWSMLAALVVLAGAAACSSAAAPAPSHSSTVRPAVTSSAQAKARARVTPAGTSVTRSTPAGKSAVAGPCSTTVHLAFGGDTNTANAAGRVLTAGMGSAGRVLARADLAMVNLETVIADDRTGLRPQPKQYNFLAPSRLLGVLAGAGVDVATMANNHGLDYGQLGLTRTLAARASAPLHLIGAGVNRTAAFAPYRTTVRGRGVAFYGATDVIDDGLAWAATADQPGLASIKTDVGYRTLRDAVRSDRAQHPCDVIVVYLHAGVERQACPTDRQRTVAADLAADGATAVLMSHAHVVEPGAVLGHTAVDYGLGNFVFSATSAVTGQTGVLQIDVPPAGPPRETWQPGHIVNGVPAMLDDSAATAARAQWNSSLKHC